MAGTPEGKTLSRRQFLGLDKLFSNRNPLDRAGYILQNRLNQFPDNKPHIVNSAVPRSLSGEAIFSLAIPEPQGIGTVTNLLPTLGVDEELIHMVGLISKRIIAPIAFGLSGGYVGFQGGVALANKSSESFPSSSVGSGQKDKVKKRSKLTRREFIFGGAGAVTGIGISEALLACNLLTPDNQSFINYDSQDYQRTTLVNRPLSETVSPPDIQRAPHATELIAELRRAVEIAKPDVSLYRTLVDYNYTKNNKTGAEFEMAFVKIGSQTNHLIVNGQERLLDEDIYMVSYIGPEGKPIARVAIWSEIPDQVGAKAFGLHLADINLLPNFKKPLLEYIKKDGEDKVRIGFFNPVTHEINDIARFTLNQPNEFSFLKALSIISNPFAVQPVEAAELIPTATPGTTKPTVIATATATVTLEPTRAASPVPMLEVGGLKIPDPRASNPELFDITKPDSPIVQFANAFGIKPEKVGNLTPKLLTGVDGKQFVVLTTGDLSATTTFDESGTPLFIAEQKDGVWRWRRIGLKDLELRLNLEAGDSLVYITADHGKGYGDYVLSDEYHQMLANNYSIITLAQGTYWKWFERTKDGPIDSWSKDDILAQIKIIQKMKQINPNLKIRIAPFGSFPEGNPDWLNGLSQDEAKIQIKEYMQQLFDLLTQNGITPDEYVVVNEPFFRGSNWVRQDALYNSLGYDYITYAFTTAREIVGNKPLLIYNDTANNSRNQDPYSYYTNLTKQQATALKQAGITNFAVGMQMHLYGNVPVNEEDLIKTMQDYGAPVYITELDVDVSMLSPQARNKALSDIYTSVFRAAIKSGVVKGISTWNGVDDLSNPVDYLRKSGASPTLFSGSVNPQPKEVYYKVLKELLSNFHN